MQDRLLIQTESGEYELVFKAVLPKPDVRILGDLNFGIIPTESKANKKIQLANNGYAQANFKIEYDRCGRNAGRGAGMEA